MKNLHKTLVILLMCLSCTGCWFSGIAAAVPAAISAITDASAALNIIQQAVNVWFARRPDNDAQAKANRLIQKTWAALRLANHSMQGVESLSQEDYDKAMTDFRNAYGELQTFLVKRGILASDKMSLNMDGDSIMIEEPSALTLKIEE